MDRRGYALLCDFYEFTMSNGYFKNGHAGKITYFDVFFREVPDGGGFAIAAGLQQVIDYIENLHFREDEIYFLKQKGIFGSDFLNYLSEFKFTGDIYAVPEGTPVFPHEPLLTVRAPAIEAQLMETFVLLTLNHQSLIATKANRMVRAAQGRPVAEFGSRRAQGADGAILGARAAYIGGCGSSACTLTDKDYHVPASGTMAHSWVQMYNDELQAFKDYCELYPHNATLLVDTYNVLQSGIPNAIRAFREILLPRGITQCAIRLDSGDLAYLSREARRMLDGAGLNECRIIATNSLDEYAIRELIAQGACIDAFGIGERLITAKSDPVFGGVYKLCAVENEGGEILPKIKISESADKINNPHFKKLYRLYANATGKAMADQMCVYDEVIDSGRPLKMYAAGGTGEHKTASDFTARELMVPVILNGETVYSQPTLEQVKQYCREQIDLLPDELKRLENPSGYDITLSARLWHIKNELLQARPWQKNIEEE